MKFTIINASIAGILLSLFIVLALYIMGPSAFANPWTSLIIFAVSIAYQVYAAFQARKENGGYFTFLEAFKFILLVSLIMSVGGLLINYLLFNVIDPEFMVQLKELVVEKSTEMFEGFNMTDEQITKAIHDTEQSFEDRKTLVGQLKGFAWSAGISVVIALILSLIVKKNNNSFVD